MIDDFDMIVSSFASEYGVRIYSQDFKHMKWDEFCSLLSGLSPDSPLGRLVQIRTENDREALKHFTKQQHRIRNDWRKRRSKRVNTDTKTVAERDIFLKQMKNAFISMAGGG